MNTISRPWHAIIEFVFIIDFEISFHERVAMCEDTVDFTVGPSLTNHLVLTSSVFKAAISSSKGFTYAFALTLIRYLWNLTLRNCHHAMWKRKLTFQTYFDFQINIFRFIRGGSQQFQTYCQQQQRKKPSTNICKYLSMKRFSERQKYTLNRNIVVLRNDVVFWLQKSKYVSAKSIH